MSTFALPIPATASTGSSASGTGSITTNILTVTGFPSGTFVVGQALYWAGNTVLVTILSLGTGTGGVGTYNTSTTANITSQTINASTGTGTPVAVPNLDGPRTFWYANGDPLDQTDLEISDDAANWVKAGTRQIGGTWSLAVTAKTIYTRLNRISVGPLGGATFTGTVVGTVLTVSSVPSSAIGLGQAVFSVVGGLPFVTIASFGTGTGGAGTYNLSSAPGNIGPIAFASAPSSFVSANDVVTLGQTGPVGTPGLGNLTVSGAIALTNGATTPITVVVAQASGSGSYQLELNIAYRNLTTGTCGSRKLTGTVRNNAGTLSVEAQSTAFTNDNAAFAGVTTVISVASSTISLTITTLTGAIIVDWQFAGVVNFST